MNKMARSKIDKEGLSHHSYTEPLGLLAQLKRPSIRLDVIPVLDLLVIALLFSLLFTRFVMMPGMRVDLPNSEMQVPASDLPVAVLTIGNRGMLFFNGAVFELNSIEGGFSRRIEEMQGKELILLIKTEGSIDLQFFLELCRMAQDAGFVQVQIAGKYLPDAEAMMPSAQDPDNLLGSGFLSVM